MCAQVGCSLCYSHSLLQESDRKSIGKRNGDFGMIRGIKGTYLSCLCLLCIILIISENKKQRWWKIISLWHRYDWYHTLVIMEIRSKRPNTKKATHSWMWMAMDVNNVKVTVCLDLWKWNTNYSFLESMGVPIMSSERLIWMASAAAFFFASTILA